MSQSHIYSSATQLCYRHSNIWTRAYQWSRPNSPLGKSGLTDFKVLIILCNLFLCFRWEKTYTYSTNEKGFTLMCIICIWSIYFCQKQTLEYSHILYSQSPVSQTWILWHRYLACHACFYVSFTLTSLLPTTFTNVKTGSSKYNKFTLYTAHVFTCQWWIEFTKRTLFNSSSRMGLSCSHKNCTSVISHKIASLFPRRLCINLGTP